MIGLLLRLLGGRMAHKVVAKHAERSGWDARLGFAMLRDGRIPLKSKLLAFGIGAALTALLLSLELPLEGILTVMMPLFGLVELPFDGLEMALGPVLVASLLLPRLAPQALVEMVRQERAGPVIDVEPEAGGRDVRMSLAR